MDGERGRTAAKLAQDVVGGSDEGFGHGLDGSVIVGGMCVGARAQTVAQAGSRTAHRMCGLCRRCRRHTGVLRLSSAALPLCLKNAWWSKVPAAWFEDARAM
jgi:hypothetical protein